MIDFVIETEIARSRGGVRVCDRPDQARELADEHRLVRARAARPDQVGHADPGGASCAGGKDMAELVEVVEYEPARVFGMRVVEGTPIHGRITFEPVDGGTRFRFRVYGQLTGIMRLAQPILRPVLKRNFAHYCATLKRVLETASPEL
jgi:polyketide cyclase/dehydrase/lipid transport protein